MKKIIIHPKEFVDFEEDQKKFNEQLIEILEDQRMLNEKQTNQINELEQKINILEQRLNNLDN